MKLVGRNFDLCALLPPIEELPQLQQQEEGQQEQQQQQGQQV